MTVLGKDALLELTILCFIEKIELYRQEGTLLFVGCLFSFRFLRGVPKAG